MNQQLKTWMLCACLIAVANGQDPVSSDADSERAQTLYAAFESTADGLELVDAASKEKYVRKKVALSKFTSEGTIFGSVYLWMDAQRRPAAIGTIGSLEIRSRDYEFVELHLLRPKPIEELLVAGPVDKRWTPNVDELALKPIEGAPPVASNERLRLVQMRNLFRQFTAEKKDIHKLRRQPTHLYRYESPTVERDGAIFSFVFDRGTDPELLLRIESRETDTGIEWHYQPIRFSWEKLTLSRNGKKLWETDEFVERDSPQQVTPYITGLTKVIP